MAARPAPRDRSPALIVSPRVGFSLMGIDSPDPWQLQVAHLATRRHTLVLTARQAGKSTTAAVVALRAALMTSGTVLIAAPTERQSTELALRVRALARLAGVPLEAEGRTYLELRGGGRVIALPENPEGVRGYSAHLVILDEAAYVSDDLYIAVRPMLAMTGGRILALSTPAGTRGWFWREWVSESDDWARVRVAAYDIGRYDPAFLEAERRALGEMAFAQEYLAEFIGQGGAIDSGLIHAAVRLPGPEDPRPGRVYVAGLDLARLQDWTALAVLDVTEEPYRLVRLERWQSTWEETVQRVLQVVAAYGARVVVDSTGVGDPVYERIRAGWARAHPYRFTAQSKPPLIQELRLSLAEERLVLYPHPVLLSELQALQAKQTAYGVTYEHPPGGHDDTVMALALALWGARGAAVPPGVQRLGW
jgi:phage FluMu gp28-like protein